jgi:predicted nucleotidyltransferase
VPDVQTARTPDTLPPEWDAARFAHVLRSQLPRLRERYGIATLELFGSYTRNEQRPESDLDVLVSFVQTPTLFDLVNLQDEMAELLGVSVDVVLRSTLRPGIARNIQRDLVQL